jgi:hypothetical protein
MATELRFNGNQRTTCDRCQPAPVLSTSERIPPALFMRFGRTLKATGKRRIRPPGNVCRRKKAGTTIRFER